MVVTDCQWLDLCRGCGLLGSRFGVLGVKVLNKGLPDSGHKLRYGVSVHLVNFIIGVCASDVCMGSI